MTQLIRNCIFSGEHKTAEYLEKTPIGQVPIVENDGLVLTERYVVLRKGSRDKVKIKSLFNSGLNEASQHRRHFPNAVLMLGRR